MYESINKLVKDTHKGEGVLYSFIYAGETRFCLSGGRLPCTAALERLLAHTLVAELCLRRNTLTSGGEILAQLIARAPLLRTRAGQDANATALVLDIGANIGVFTTYLASEGCEVIAVEPFAINMGCLMQTVCMNPGMA